MDDKGSIEIEEPYDDCSHYKDSVEHINKEFKSFHEYYSNLANIMPTVEREINSDTNEEIDLYQEQEPNDDFYHGLGADVYLSDATTQEGTDNE